MAGGKPITHPEILTSQEVFCANTSEGATNVLTLARRFNDHTRHLQSLKPS